MYVKYDVLTSQHDQIEMASDSEEENVAVVLDVGSYHLSYGLSGEETPKFSKLVTATEDDTNDGQVGENKIKYLTKY